MDRLGSGMSWEMEVEEEERDEIEGNRMDREKERRGEERGGEDRERISNEVREWGRLMKKEREEWEKVLRGFKKEIASKGEDIIRELGRFREEMKEGMRSIKAGMKGKGNTYGYKV